MRRETKAPTRIFSSKRMLYGIVTKYSTVIEIRPSNSPYQFSNAAQLVVGGDTSEGCVEHSSKAIWKVGVMPACHTCRREARDATTHS